MSAPMDRLDLSEPRAAERGLSDDESDRLIRARYAEALRKLGDESSDDCLLRSEGSLRAPP